MDAKIAELEKKIESLPIGEERDNLIKEKVVLEWIRDGYPTVFCPKEDRKVPVWFCLGSFVQKRERCPNLIEITVRSVEESQVKCNYKKVIT